MDTEEKLRVERLAGRLEKEARVAQRNAKAAANDPITEAYEDGKALAYSHAAALTRKDGGL